MQVSSFGSVSAVAAGYGFAYAFKSDGTVWAWGDNGYGQLGNNSTSDSHVPVQVSGFTATPPPAPSTLIFSIQVGAAPDGGSVSGSAVNFGMLAPNQPKTAHQLLSVSTNAANGCSISVQEDHPLRQQPAVIPDVLGDQGNISEITEGNWNYSSTYGFGYTLSGPNAAFTAGFKQFADKSAGKEPQVIMTETAPGSGTVT